MHIFTPDAFVTRGRCFPAAPRRAIRTARRTLAVVGGGSLSGGRVRSSFYFVRSPGGFMRRTVSTLALGLIAAVAVAAVATSCGSDSTAPTNKTFVATMLPSNEVPTAKTTTGTGVATFVDKGNEIDWTVELTGMTGVFASHIHLGDAATVGPVIFNLFIPQTPNPATLTGVVGSGTITNANNPAITLDSLRVLFNNGHAYVNVHTSANGAGEIRGQVALK